MLYEYYIIIAGSRSCWVQRFHSFDHPRNKARSKECIIILNQISIFLNCKVFVNDYRFSWARQRAYK